MTQQTRQTIALVLAGGRGSRLKNLTDRRAKPAVYFGGKYRIIDFALSNCINSGVRRIFVMTQYKSHSLLRHLQRGWGFLRGDLGEFVDLLPAQQRVEESLWYRGTADAVFQNLDILTSESPDYVLVLAGDHVYKQDYGAMIEAHARSGAEATVCCLEVPREQATAFGVMDVDDTGKVTAFLEKPANPPGLPDKPELTLASMGIYVFNAGFLFDYLAEHAFDTDSSHDFGKDVIPTLVDQGKVMSHRFEDSCIYSPGQTEAYWRDVGTIDAYWEANMDLCSPTPELNLYDKDWRIYTDHPQLPPAKFVFDNDERRGVAVDSVVSGGCIISGSAVRRSFLFSGVRVNSYAQVDEAVILPNVDIGRHARLRRVVVDRGCEIPEGMVVGEDPAEDARRFYRTEDKGITLITREMLAALNKG